MSIGSAERMKAVEMERPVMESVLIRVFPAVFGRTSLHVGEPLLHSRLPACSGNLSIPKFPGWPTLDEETNDVQ